MKIPPRLALALGVTLLLTACATIAPPQPPSLELPKPPTDLRATRKGNRVVLTWTVPQATTDRKTIRIAGQTRICRIIDSQVKASQLKQCETPVGEYSPSVPAGADAP